MVQGRGQAGAEIEITSEMIEAGAREVSAFDPAWGSSSSEVAEKVFRAMHKVVGRTSTKPG